MMGGREERDEEAGSKAKGATEQDLRALRQIHGKGSPATRSGAIEERKKGGEERKEVVTA